MIPVKRYITEQGNKNEAPLIRKEQFPLKKKNPGIIPRGVTVNAGDIKQPENQFSMSGPDPLVEKKELLSAKIKDVINDMLESSELPVTNISVHIATKMHLNYSYLSDVFSSVNGITIEHYIIRKKVEKAMELLASTETEIGKIAQGLNYKSCTHFSAQFRAVTGYRPTYYRKMVREGCIETKGNIARDT